MFLSRLPGHDARGSVTPFFIQRLSGYGSGPIADPDTQLLTDCDAMLAARDSLLADYATSIGGGVSDEACQHDHTKQLVDDVARYGCLIAATPALTGLGLQKKGTIVGLLLGELTDDPSPICDKLLLSLLSDFEEICVHRAAPSLLVDLAEHVDEQLISACRRGLEQIEKVSAECIRIAALPLPQETEQLSTLLLSHLMETRRFLAGIAGIAAVTVAGAQVKGNLLRHMMTIGEADVHYARLALARSFVADIALLEPLLDAEIRTVGSSPHWWTNFANRFLRMTGNAPIS